MISLPCAVPLLIVRWHCLLSAASSAQCLLPLLPPITACGHSRFLWSPSPPSITPCCHHNLLLSPLTAITTSSDHRPLLRSPTAITTTSSIYCCLL